MVCKWTPLTTPSFQEHIHTHLWDGHDMNANTLDGSKDHLMVGKFTTPTNTYIVLSWQVCHQIDNSEVHLMVWHRNHIIWEKTIFKDRYVLLKCMHSPLKHIGYNFVEHGFAFKIPFFVLNSKQFPIFLLYLWSVSMITEENEKKY